MRGKPLWTLGLMSGTAADGIDGALIQTDGRTITAFGPTHYMPYPKDLRSQILEAYGRPPGPETIPLAQTLTKLHADVVFALLEQAGMKPSELDLIGFHGQALFHRPPLNGIRGETHQIGDGKLLATLTGVPVVEQFRINDVAHGGQGAPLVPVFHQALAKDLPKPLGVVNIGGVANITWIGEQEKDLLGFDTGPGNGLIDDWIREKTDLSWDEDGKIAAQGQVNESLLERWFSHPFFSRKPPKSLDRKTFQDCIKDIKNLPFEDGIATLTAFTAMSFKKALNHLPKKPLLWIVAGGGAHNLTLLKMAEKYLESEVKKSAELGWNNDALEAQAFAFLAVRSINNYPLSFPGTTGVPAPLTGGRICNP